MTTLSRIIEALHKTGATADQILAVVKVYEDDQREQEALKREKARQRQIKCRENKNTDNSTDASHDVTLVTVTGVTTPSQGSDGFPSDSLSLTPNSPPKENTPKGVQKKRGSRLADDWRLPEEWGQWAEDRKVLDVSQIINQAQMFRDYWHARAGPAAVKLDWFATWRIWIRNEENKVKNEQLRRQNRGFGAISGADRFQ